VGEERELREDDAEARRDDSWSQLSSSNATPATAPPRQSTRTTNVAT
jgi:hypothetical protein